MKNKDWTGGSASVLAEGYGVATEVGALQWADTRTGMW